MANQMDIEVKRPGELTAGELAAWRSFQAADPMLASPYFHPEFTLAVEEVRRDARVAIVRTDDRIDGFLPFQTGPLNCGRPIGGPLSDFHGVIAAPDARLDMREVARRASIALFGYHFVPADQTRHGFDAGRHDECHVIGLEDGYDQYRRNPALSPSAFKTLESRRRRIDRDFKSMDIVLDDRSDAAFDTLIAWKRAQFEATGFFDVFSVSWTQALLRTLRRRRSAEFGGLVSSLYLDGQLAAVHFGIRSASALHYWFPAYDPAFSRYSAGNILLDGLARGCGDHGWSAIHLGPGDYRYKLEFASRTLPMIGGVLRTPSVCASMHQVAHGVSGRLADAGLARLAGLSGKALRRIDHIAGFQLGA